MRILTLLACAVLSLSACTEPPSLGTVVSNRFEPAHNEQRSRQVYDGTHTEWKYDWCASRDADYNCVGGMKHVTVTDYRTEYYTVWIPDQWHIGVERSPGAEGDENYSYSTRDPAEGAACVVGHTWRKDTKCQSR